METEKVKPMDAVKEFGGYLVYLGTNTSKVAGFVIAAPYVIPTAIRRFKGKGIIGGKIRADESGLDIGFAAGLGTHTIAGIYLAQHNCLEALLIPVATNFISGAYEIARYVKGERVKNQRKEQA